MPLDKLVLILVIVIVAAGATVFLGAWIMASSTLPWLGLGMAIPVGLLAYIVLRVVRDRLTNSDDDHYDRVEK